MENTENTGSINLKEVLLPTQGVTSAEYKKGLDDLASTLPEKPGKKTFARYVDCLVKGANIVAFLWDQGLIEDEVIYRKKDPSIPLGDSARIIETGPLSILNPMKNIIDEGVVEQKSGDFNTAPRVKTAIERILDGDFNNNKAFKNVPGSSLIEAHGQRLRDKIEDKLLPKKEDKLPELDGERYGKATKQVETIVRAAEKLKSYMDKQYQDAKKAGTEKEVKPLTTAVNTIVSDLKNAAGQFLDSKNKGFGRA